MDTERWERLLVTATKGVMDKLSSTPSSVGGKTIGSGASGDMTLVADKEAEDILLQAILEEGSARIISEEAGRVGDPESPVLAVVDPLDGSSNYSQGIPFYCTSVAMVEGRGLEGVKVGVVRDLVSGDVYTAQRGHGAKKNGQRVISSEVTNAREAVAGVDLSRGTEALAAELAPLLSGVKRQVHFGANALEICMLADGRLDTFVDLRHRIRVTDFAAAYLIASEAGAVFSDRSGEPLEVQLDLGRHYSFIGSGTSSLHKEILGLTRKVGGH